MCGHGMAVLSLIEHLTDKVKQGTATMDAACRARARQCHCGIFNPARAAELLRTYITGQDCNT